MTVAAVAAVRLMMVLRVPSRGGAVFDEPNGFVGERGERGVRADEAGADDGGRGRGEAVVQGESGEEPEGGRSGDVDGQRAEREDGLGALLDEAVEEVAGDGAGGGGDGDSGERHVSFRPRI